MEYYLAVFSSITLARRVKNEAVREGSYMGIINTPKHRSKGGCTYALRFKKGKLSEVKKIAQAFDVRIKGIYKEIQKDDEKVYEKI